MRAKSINEMLNFERGKSSKESIGVGINTMKGAEVYLKSLRENGSPWEFMRNYRKQLSE